VAIIFTGLLIAVSVTLNLDLLVKAASTAVLLSNIFAHLSVIVMRESSVKNYRPTYRAPFYPWLQIVAILSFVLLIVDMGHEPVLLSLGFVSVGVILYFVRKGRIKEVSPALIHLIQRITNKELVTRGLQNELREIVEDRDGIVRDEFDRLVEHSCYVHLPSNASLQQLWEAVTDTLGECIPGGITPQQLTALLEAREADSSTAISDFVAIPHLILPGEGSFSMVMVKADGGVAFDKKHPEIHAIFILMGSRDNRNLHLRALAAIAQVAQQTDFEQSWIKARSHRELKDLFFLSNRQRNV
jgi:mannitol/fructose-specific phosphotransferase system IIA component (Ntr-type)